MRNASLSEDPIGFKYLGVLCCGLDFSFPSIATALVNFFCNMRALCTIVYSVTFFRCIALKEASVRAC